MKIGLVSISVPDPMKAFKFYTEVLGFKEKMYMPEAWLAIVVSPEDPDGTAILLEPRGNFGSKEYYDGLYNAGMQVIIFNVGNINGEYEKLKAKGVVFKKPPTKTDWGWEAIFDDTCGNFIQLAQM